MNDGLFDPIDNDGNDVIERLSAGIPHCCGQMTVCIESGGCGGRGAIHGCGVCGKAYHQTMGGFIGTPGGERWESYDFLKPKDVKRRVADRLKYPFGRKEDE